jgi:excinuclease ABC subunit A
MPLSSSSSVTHRCSVRSASSAKLVSVYIRLGQSVTELSGGEAQRTKLATELQRAQNKATLYVLDEPTTGLHPFDVEKLMRQLDGLVASGNTVVVVEHDMDVGARSDWVIDIGPGAGDEGGKVVACGRPLEVPDMRQSRPATYLSRAIKQTD